MLFPKTTNNRTEETKKTMKKSIYFGKLMLLSVMVGMSMSATAQNAERNLCDFESPESYASVSVYDTWENSPFRNNTISGNVRVVKNHLTGADSLRGFTPNASSHILALQRSRFGSNTFGALVGLREPFAQTKQKRYVHVKIYSPKSAPAMLIGLGNRDNRPGQSPLTEQFWSTSTQPLVAGQWNDAVFPMFGSDGVTIRHLLIVPDATSPHNLDADFAAFIDDIVISDDDKPFFTTSGKAAVKTFKEGDLISLSRGVDALGGGLNGDILLADGSAVTGKTAICGKPVSVKAVPAPGFRFSKLVIRHGRNLDGAQEGNWTETTVSASKFKNGEYTIPGGIVDGDLRLVPYFSSESAK